MVGEPTDAFGIVSDCADPKEFSGETEECNGRDGVPIRSPGIANDVFCPLFSLTTEVMIQAVIPVRAVAPVIRIRARGRYIGESAHRLMAAGERAIVRWKFPTRLTLVLQNLERLDYGIRLGICSAAGR